ncbi:MAG: DUF364 domain-containing protein [Pseudodesulfovibrio sp.]
MQTTLEIVRDKSRALWKEMGILDEPITVTAGPLSVRDAIGDPEGRDFPIQKGKEKLMDAVFRGMHGQAFTDHYGNYSGTLDQVVNLPFDSNHHRAVFVAALNAVCRSTGTAKGTVHCKDAGPGECARLVAAHVRENYNVKRVTMIGFQPALAEAMSQAVDLRLVDLDPDNVGQTRRGVYVEGADATANAIDWGELLLVTGTTLANDTIDLFLRGKPVLFYGTTISGAAALMGWERFCPRSA